MIQLDFKGSDVKKVAQNLINAIPALTGKVCGSTDENGRNYLEIDYEFVTKEQVKEIIEKSILEEKSMQREEQAMAEPKHGFSFTAIMEQEINAMIEKSLAESKAKMDAFRGEVDKQRQELVKVVAEFKAQATQKMSEIDAIIKSQLAEQDKKITAQSATLLEKIGQALEQIKQLFAQIDKWRQIFKGL